MASEIKVDTVSEKTSGSGVTIDGLLIKDGGISGDVSLIGTTPTFTIGDAGAEDAALVFDGNAQDFYIALDDSADDLLIGLGSTVGTTAAVSIDENLQVKIVATTASTSATTGSLIAAGGAGIAADLHVGDDVTLISDSAVLGFGADKDTTLTHTDGTGLTLNSTNKLCFNDASQFVQGSSATVLSIGATDEIDLTATAIDINGTCDISGTFSLAGTNVTATAAELNILDGVTATASELNLLDGGTSVGSSITLADADGFVVNDGGTMKTIPASDISAYAGGTLVQTGTSFFESSQSSDTITLSNCFSATYDHYILYMYLLTSSNGANVNMDVASSGGNYQSLFNYSSRYFDSDGNVSSHTGQSTSSVVLGTCSSNPRDGGLAGILHFHTNNNHSSASASGAFNCQGFYRSVATNSDQTVRAYYHGSYFRDTGDNNVPINLLFSPSSGNWEQASLKMFGVKGSAS
jgi:hypothetical protein